MTDAQIGAERVALGDGPIGEVSQQLREALGQSLTAYAISEDDSSRIGRIVHGQEVPTEAEEGILRGLARTVGAKRDEGWDDDAVRKILTSSCARFGGRPPVEVIRDGGATAVFASL